MLATIGTLLDVGLKLFGLRGDLGKARRERKGQIAQFLESIAQNIAHAGADLRNGTCPHGICQILLSHSQQMEAAIGDLVGQQQAADLGAQLHGVWQIERLFGELGSLPPDERERNLHALDQTSGLFQATAEFVKASP